VPHELVGFQPQELAIRNRTLEATMLYSGGKLLYKSSDDFFARILFEKKPPKLSQRLQIFLCDLPAIEKAKDETIYEERLERFGQVQSEGKASGAWLMKEAHRRMQGRVVYL